MKKQLLLGLSAAILASTANSASAAIADEYIFAQSLLTATEQQANFDAISETLTSAAVFRSVKSPRPSGSIVGVDANLEISMIDMSGANSILTALGTDTFSGTAPFAKIHGYVAIPFGLGASFYTQAAKVDGISSSGYEISYAIIDGDVGFIAEATYTLSAAYNNSTLTWDDAMEVTSTGMELRAALGFDLPMLEATVYVGIGKVSMDSVNLATALTLADYSVDENKNTIGAEAKVGIFNFGMETDTIGSISTVSYKLGFGFGF